MSGNSSGLQASDGRSPADLIALDGRVVAVTGAGGKKADSFRNDARTVPRDDRGAFNHFMVLRVTGDRFGYCVIDAEGAVRDRGGFARGDAADGEFEGEFCSPAAPP